MTTGWGQLSFSITAGASSLAQAEIEFKQNFCAKADGDQIIGWCRDKLDGYKLPKSVEIVDNLLKTPSGKILKHILRERFSHKA